MTKLNKVFLDKNKLSKELLIPEGWNQLPEKVMQFGTGVLLRGLPDYFIDKANRKGVFNGRVVVIKSTNTGHTDEFNNQDALYTLHVKGIEDGKEIQQSIVISSISRVLSANQQWLEVLNLATKSELEVIISNTTEVGIFLDEKDDIKANPPRSFPGKLTALLHKRFSHFKGKENKGWVILPTELISDNGAKLKGIVIELSRIHHLDEDFINWVDKSNHFCNTLVDRIVPGKLPSEEQKNLDQQLGYIDDLAIMAEPFRLWAIEAKDDKVAEVLSFAKSDKGVIIVPDIWKFKELKLRLLNGSHTFSCGLAVLSGFRTVKEAMQNKDFTQYVRLLMEQEIVPAIISENIKKEEALDFASKVIDRFSNPFLNHQWLSISLNYTSKMQMRNAALLEKSARKQQSVPLYMALGFAAYLRFMKCEKNADGLFIGRAGDKEYTLNDEQAFLFADLWSKYKSDDVVDNVLKNQSLWKTDLSLIPDFAETVKKYLQQLEDKNVLEVIRQLNKN